MLNVTTAVIQDAEGAELIIKALRKRWPWLKHLFADGAYQRVAWRRGRHRNRPWCKNSCGVVAGKAERV
jgi:hypothetical protein